LDDGNPNPSFGLCRVAQRSQRPCPRVELKRRFVAPNYASVGNNEACVAGNGLRSSLCHLVCASDSSANAAGARERKRESLGNIPALKTFSRCGILTEGGSDVSIISAVWRRPEHS
jgi:hypothetical protein